MRIQRFSDARAFLDRAEQWLLRREAEHNLLLGLADQLCRDHGYQLPIYLATVLDDEERVSGCAFRTPPFKLGLTRLPTMAIPLLGHDVAQVYDELPAVLGPESEAKTFAQWWTQCKGVDWKIGMRQRLHVLHEVTPSTRAVTGGCRLANRSEISTLAEWAEAFVSETGVPNDDPVALAERLIDDEALFVWEDTGTLCSMVAVQGATPSGVRISFVYTPPTRRRHGYATAAVAEITQLMLDSGREFCVLYTDLANPTSNSIYHRIGYRPLRDVIDINFI